MAGKGRPDFSIAAFIAVLLAWNAFQLYLMNQPQRGFHDAGISQQIGRTARNHLVLGFLRTKGTNVTCVRQDGSLELHPSYSPLASWTAAVPMALGVPFRASTKIATIASMNLFFVAFWYVLRQHGDPWSASLGVAFAAMFPGILMQYGQSCIFEVLGLGPTFCALALFSQPRRSTGIWLAIAVSSILGVMDSWFDVIIVAPFALREFLGGGRRMGLIIAISSLVVPLAIHFTTLILASGSIEPIKYLFSHAMERAGSGGDGGEIIPYTKVVSQVVIRWKTQLGTLAFAATIWWIVRQVVEWRKTEEGFTTVVLLAYGLPLNIIMKNASYHHDFFIIMFAPLSALALTRVTGLVLGPTGEREGRQILGMVLIFLGFLTFDVVPIHYAARASEGDVRRAAIGDEVARHIRPEDFVIAGPSFFYHSGFPDGSRYPDGLRETAPEPIYCGRMIQSAFLVYDADDAAHVIEWARPDQRIVILLQDDDIWDIDQNRFRPIPTGIKDFVIGVRDAKVSAGGIPARRVGGAPLKDKARSEPALDPPT